MRRKHLLIIMLICMSLFAGCGRKPEQKPAPPPTLIGVSVTSADKELKQELKKSMEEDAKKDNIRILWKESEPAKQEDDIKKILEQKIKALVVEFGDEKVAEAVARLAKEKDVPLLALGTMPANVPLDGFVGIDAYRTGTRQADFLVKALNRQKPAKIMILKGMGNSAEEEVTKGNVDGLQAVTGFEPIIQEVLPGESAAAVVARSPALNQIKGLITHKSAWTEEIVTLLQDMELDKKIVTVGLGAGKNNARAIENGTHEAEVDINPELLGKFAYTGAKELAQQGQWQFEKRVTSGAYDIPVKYTPANVINKDNIYILQTRYKDLNKPQQSQGEKGPAGEGQEGQNKSSSGSGGSGGSGGGEKQQGQEKKKSVVKIQTKEGKTMEIEVEGEVQKVEIQGKQGGQSAQGETGGGAQGGGGQAGGSQ
ncbi:sugar ABC transporter substrate-binding protein [Zhaonella formicivorans]|uniref:sugar ABC transporter substrate-binding protein n=1 Tax=Zhaonella formicivorans TaxID=2528593 RepID=UPI0010D63010|nr:substrate-binding domain-containing protein [Zhaonella formicivorans]